VTSHKFNLDIDAEIKKLGLPPAKVANPANREENQAKVSNFSKFSNPPDLNINNPNLKKNPDLGLLTEVELEAFNGWYASCRKPKFGMSHEEAVQKSWELLIESIRIIYKKQGKRI
jgi:hypothetical protein|tara:strand:- start:324 stop:671 length:348 start_codon:yes stop_codon:yes gene_type:complete